MRWVFGPLVALIALLYIPFAEAADLPSAKPEEVGFSSERLARAMGALKSDIDEGTIAGAVLLVARHGKIAYFEAAGLQDPATKAPMTRDSIFRIYSMSKPIATVAAMMLAEEGKFLLADPVARTLPPLADLKVGVEKTDPATGAKTLELVPAQRPITIQDLMRHTSGLTYGFFGNTAVKKLYADANLFDGDFTNADLVERLAKLPLAYQPGTTWDYSHSTDVLGRVIEVISGQSLYDFEKARLLEPLGMSDTSFYVTDKGKQARLAEPLPNDRNIGVGVDFFDPRIERKWQSAGGGMMSTAMDYARFLQMMLNGGTLEGRRYLGARTVAYMTSDHLGGGIVPGPYYLPGPGYGFGLGFAVRRDQGVASTPGTPGDYYWAGAGGTYFWVDPKEDFFVVLMMQAPKNRNHYRALLRDMIYAALEKWPASAFGGPDPGPVKRPAAIHRDESAADIARVRRRQEEREISDIGQRSHPPQRDTLYESGLSLRACPREAAEAFGAFDRARRNRIDANAVGAPFHGEHPHHLIEPGLGGAGMDLERHRIEGLGC